MSPPTMPDLRGLLERVEGATGPSYVLEAEIRDALAGPNTHARRDEDGNQHLSSRSWIGPPPPYTCSIDVALALIERVLPEWSWSIGNLSSGAQAYVMRSQAATLIGGNAKTPALALLAAMLRALIAQEGE